VRKVVKNKEDVIQGGDDQDENDVSEQALGEWKSILYHYPYTDFISSQTSCRGDI